MHILQQLLNRLFIVCLFTLAGQCALWADDALDSAWTAGDEARLRQLLATTTDEQAKTFYTAMLQPNQSKAAELLLTIKQTGEGACPYMAPARVELAKMALLDRDADSALRHLNLVSIYPDPDVKYWTACAWLAKSDWARCIQSAQDYIAASDDALKIEETWFLIAEAYTRKGDYNRALNTLHKLKADENLRNIPLMLYQLGYCHEMLGDWNDAKGYYRRLMVDYAYTPQAYRAEDRMLAMRNTQDAGLDVRDFSICDQDRESAVIERETAPPDAEPTLKFWLQVGAFSTLDRARNRADELKADGYPAGVFSKVVNGKEWRVAAVGPFADRTAALEMKQRLSDDGLSTMLLQRY